MIVCSESLFHFTPADVQYVNQDINIFFIQQMIFHFALFFNNSFLLPERNVVYLFIP